MNIILFLAFFVSFKPPVDGSVLRRDVGSTSKYPARVAALENNGGVYSVDRSKSSSMLPMMLSPFSFLFPPLPRFESPRFFRYRINLHVINGSKVDSEGQAAEKVSEEPHDLKEFHYPPESKEKSDDFTNNLPQSKFKRTPPLEDAVQAADKVGESHDSLSNGFNHHKRHAGVNWILTKDLSHRLIKYNNATYLDRICRRYAQVWNTIQWRSMGLHVFAIMVVALILTMALLYCQSMLSVKVRIKGLKVHPQDKNSPSKIHQQMNSKC